MANGKAGAPFGNKNGAGKREWSDAIRRAVARRGKGKEGGLNKLADKLLDKVEEGDMAAIREFGDRFEGKVPQAIEGTGEDGSFNIVITSRDKNVL